MNIYRLLIAVSFSNGSCTYGSQIIIKAKNEDEALLKAKTYWKENRGIENSPYLFAFGTWQNIPKKIVGVEELFTNTDIVLM
jgi:hypothetical protein